MCCQRARQAVNPAEFPRIHLAAQRAPRPLGGSPSASACVQDLRVARPAERQPPAAAYSCVGHSTVTAGHLLTHSQPAAGHEQAVEDALAPLSTPPPPAQSLYSSADPDWKVPGCGSRGDERAPLRSAGSPAF